MALPTQRLVASVSDCSTRRIGPDAIHHEMVRGCTGIEPFNSHAMREFDVVELPAARPGENFANTSSSVI